MVMIMETVLQTFTLVDIEKILHQLMQEMVQIVIYNLFFSSLNSPKV